MSEEVGVGRYRHAGVVEAVQNRGTETAEVALFLEGRECVFKSDGTMLILHPDGRSVTTVPKGSYVVRGYRGNWWVCSERGFDAMFEKVDL